MKNLFSTENYPTVEPNELVVGARWAWTRPDITSAYPTTAYTLKYRFNLLSANGAVKTFTATKTDGAHVVEVASATTADYAKGDYSWQAVVVRDSDNEEVVVDQGYSILITKMSGETADSRSHTYITLMAIRATIQGSATREQQSHTIAGRSLSRRSLEELTKLEQEYNRRWNDEVRNQRRKSGRKAGNRVLAKMRA